jgi:effector-binding domain-containing protein
MNLKHQIQLVRVEPLITAVICDRVPQSEFSKFVPAACGEVWKYFREAGLPKPGRHLALYLDGKGSIEVGAEVAAPFKGTDRIVCSRTPGGPVATAAHFGPYDSLGEAHRAIQNWCADHGHRTTGVSWEIYGHWLEEWNRDPSKIRTDVFYLVDAKHG